MSASRSVRILALVFVLAGCAVAPPVKEAKFTGAYRNACLPEAAAMCEGLKGAGIKANVLIINTPTWSHALATYMYPTGANQLWCWDSTWKSIRLRAFWGDATGIAQAWLTATRSNTKLNSAELLQ